MTDERLQQNATEWLGTFIRDRFPQGLNATIEPIVKEIAFDAFLDGVAFGSDVATTEGRIVGPEGSGSQIVIASR